MNLSLDDEIAKLELDHSYVKILNDNGIYLVKDLWTKSRKDLKNLNFTDSEINYIKIKLQLCGLDLDQKIYK